RRQREPRPDRRPGARPRPRRPSGRRRDDPAPAEVAPRRRRLGGPVRPRPGARYGPDEARQRRARSEAGRLPRREHRPRPLRQDLPPQHALRHRRRARDDVRRLQRGAAPARGDAGEHGRGRRRGARRSHALHEPAHRRVLLRSVDGRAARGQHVARDMRLNAYLARTGVASRRGADELIKRGRIRVNGVTAGLSTYVEEGDVVDLDGRLLLPQAIAYVLLHKPAGVVTTASDPHGRPTVVELVEHPSRVVPGARLDADTTGALLLTTAGELAHRLAHPRYEVEKVYESEVEGEPSDEALAALERGVELDDGPTAPARVRRIGPSLVELSIHEGRKHQVKRMLEAVRHPLARLRPSRYADLSVHRPQPPQRAPLTRDASV